MSKRWEPIRLRGVGDCHKMRQGVMGNASIFARELGDALLMVNLIYYCSLRVGLSLCGRIELTGKSVKMK